MNEAFVKKHIEHIYNAIKKQVHHKTLHENEGDPNIAEEKLFYLLFPLLNGEKWTDYHEKAAISVGIVNAALSSHENIHEYNATSKQQQLSVLAGDYFSGIHYRILSNIPDVPFIQKLSRAIVEISESKAYFYEPSLSRLKDSLKAANVEESKSIEAFYKHFHFEHYIPLVQQALLVNRLKIELDLYINAKSSKFLDAIIHSEEFSFGHFKVVQYLTDKINEISAEIDSFIENSTFITKDLKSLLQKRMAPILT